MVRTTGFTKNTPDNLLLDAGAIYKNLTYDSDSGTFEGELLGATSGGNELSIEIETRTPEIDGMRGRIKGLSFTEEHNASLTVNLKELSAENVRLAIGAADVDVSDENYDVINGRFNLEEKDYLENIAYVGRLSNNSKPVVVILDNVVSAEGLELAAEDNNEAVIPITFNAHSDIEDAIAGKAPYTIYYPKPAIA